MPHAIKKQDKADVYTVEEKVHLESHLPYNCRPKNGPTFDLFFHELNSKKGTGQKIIGFVGEFILTVIFVATLPLIAGLIKLFARENVIQKAAVPGKRGILFQRYSYSTSHAVGAVLQKTGLYKLPSVINIWKGEMNLIGPGSYATEKCNKWNQHLSDYYKRFALPPGYIGVAKHIKDADDLQEVKHALQQELNYILSRTFKKDLNLLFKGPQ